ncbi:MAG: hypothetical protein OXP69_12750, partial [Spirochaetaceae bacterium]|nr:hypothetical protein [Spirochaetaceae bacterium]
MSERAEPLTVDDRQPESGVGRRVALAAVPVAAVLLVLLAAVWRPAEVAVPAGGASDRAVLPSQGENVVAVAVDFG